MQEITPSDLPKESIASKRDLEELLKWVWLKGKDPEKMPILLQNWRREFGQKLLLLIG